MTDIVDLYSSAYNKLDEVINRHISQECLPALGYTSNLDILCDFRIEVINNLISRELPDFDLNEMKPARVINNMNDLLQTIVYYCRQGFGGEADISDLTLCDNLFETKLGIGGTSSQAAMALSAIGCSSIIHLTDDSNEVCKILHSEHIYTVDSCKTLIHTDEVEQKKEQEVHFIVQFAKGDVLRLGNQKIKIPNSNRLILTKFTVNKELPFYEPYFSYIENHSNKVSSIVLSSFNAIENMDILLERMEFLKRHIDRYRMNNKNGIVYFEDAHYHNYEIRKACSQNIYSYIDILSLNEEELAYTLQHDGYDININDIESCINGLKFMIEKFKIKKGIIVHTKDYSMYVGNLELNVDIESSLIYGNMLATAKALFGSYGTMEQLKDVIKLPLSKRGQQYKKEVEGLSNSINVILIPTKYIEKPKYTIGLGDSFVAGAQLPF